MSCRNLAAVSQVIPKRSALGFAATAWTCANRKRKSSRGERIFFAQLVILRKDVLASRRLVAHEAAVSVLLSAMEPKPDWLLTHNTKHFTPQVAKRTGLQISSPAAFFLQLTQGLLGSLDGDRGLGAKAVLGLPANSLN